MPENCDEACVKTIINTRLIAYIARHLAEVADVEGNAVFRSARILASASRAACEAYRVAIEEGTLVYTHERVQWQGCEEAAYLIQITEHVRSRKRIDMRDAEQKMTEWTDRANRITAALVRKQE